MLAPDKKKAGNARFPLAPETFHAAGTSAVGMPSIRANAAARGKTQASNLDVRFAPGKLADEAYVGCRVLDCKAFGPQAAKSFVACSLVIVALSPILVISILL